MNYTSFGYEHENGYIVYTFTKEYSLDELFEIITSRKLPETKNSMSKVLCIEDYFNDQLFEKENTKWRIVFLLDGNTILRNVSTNGNLLYRV